MFLIYVVIGVSLFNLTLGHGTNNMWVALLASCLVYVLSNSSVDPSHAHWKDTNPHLRYQQIWTRFTWRHPATVPWITIQPTPSVIITLNFPSPSIWVGAMKSDCLTASSATVITTFRRESVAFNFEQQKKRSTIRSKFQRDCTTRVATVFTCWIVWSNWR